MTLFVMWKVSGDSARVRISAPGADITPNLGVYPHSECWYEQVSRSLQAKGEKGLNKMLKIEPYTIMHIPWEEKRQSKKFSP